MNAMFRKVLVIASLLVCGSAWSATDWSTRDYDLYPGDFDGDGKTDLLYVAKDPGKVSGIARSDGSGPNLPFQTWPSNFLGIPWSTNTYSVVVADFNHDGRADIFLQRKTPGDHYLLLADSLGKITGIAQTIPTPYLGLDWSGTQHKLIAGDFDGNGFADIFLQATSPSGLNAVMLASNPGGLFQSAPAQSWSRGAGDMGFGWSTLEAQVYAGDFDGDGRADLLIQAKPKWVMIDADVTIPIPTYPPAMNGVVLSRALSPMFQSGNAQRWSRVSNGVDWSTLASTVVVGDFDGNGTADIIVQALRSGATSYRMSGNASGAIFSAPAAMAANVTWSADSYRLLVGNFDGTPGAGLFLQSTSGGGTNYYANSVTGGTVSLSTHNSATPTGVVPATAVGRTPGSFAVAGTGAATYSIPIVAPPGVAGVQPTIGISYHSGRGNGLLGVGWSLSGFSEISRCRKTIAQDGTNGSPQVLAADSYCLDGNKLRLTSGSYGAASSTYQTEIDQFTRITAFNNGNPAAGGPGYFIAEGKNGLIYEYGHTGNSLDDVSFPSTWLLNKVRDRSGNYMTYTYAADSAGLPASHPTRIDYTSNDGSSPAVGAAYSIVFSYEGRATNDIITRLVGNNTARENLRIASIETRYLNLPIRTYKLSYSTSGSTGRTRLNAVQECDASSNCLSPTMISWQDGEVDVGADQTGPNLGSLAPYAYPIDVNGDGKADIVSPGTTNWNLTLASGSGYGAVNGTTVAHNGNYSKALPLDYNADGRMDLLVPDASSNWQVLQSTGTGFTVVSTGFAATGAGGKAWVADVDGNGYADLVFVNAANNQLQGRLNSSSGFSSTISTFYSAPSGWTISTQQSSSTSSPYYYSVISQGDFNGDNRSDLLLSLSNGSTPVPKVLMSNGTGFVDSGLVFSDSSNAFNQSKVLATWRPLDANADGLMDIAFIDSSGFWKIAYGRPGNSPQFTVVQSTVASTIESGTAAILALDWDGDARTDIMVASNPPPLPGGTWQWLRATGDTLPTIQGGQGSMTGTVGSPPANTGVLTVPPQTVVADINGDGLADLGWPDSSNNWHYMLRKGAMPDLVRAVTDGFGNSVTVTYAPLTDTSVHTRNVSLATYPEMDVVVPMYVVKQYTANDAIGGTFTMTHSYTGARVSLTGRGFEGFTSATETDSRTGIQTVTTFNQLFPFTATVDTTTVKQPNGKTISLTQNHYADQVVNPGTSTERHFTYADSVTETTYEVNATNGAIDGAAVSRTTTGTSVDSFGNSTTVTESAYDMTSGSPVLARTTQTVTTPDNDQTNWCIGFMLSQAITNTVPGQSALTRTTQYVKDTANLPKCRPSSKIVEPGNALLAATTVYGYDAFGHVNSETISGTGITNRVMATSYGTQGVLQTSVTNAENEIVSTTYNYKFGTPATVTDSSGITTTYTFDGFGRKLTEARADGTSTAWTLYACNIGNSYCGDPLLRYQVLQQQKDSTGAVMRSATQMFDSQARVKYLQSQATNGTTASIATNYDSMGRVSQKSQPYFAGSAAVFTTVAYDLVGRKLSESRRVSDADGTTQSTTYDYNRLVQTLTDAKGKVTVKTANAIGQIVQVTDPNTVNTSYEYDPFGNLTRTTGPAGDVSTDHYNIRGLKDSSADPDQGSIAYSYYPTGEVKDQTNARGQVVSFTYDRMGRIKTRTEIEGTTTFVYGTSTANKNVGKVTSVSVSPGGYAEAFTYDPLGRPFEVTTTIDGTNYVVSKGYSSTTGFLDTVTYPTSTAAVTNSRFKLQYAYSYGQITAVKDFYTPTTVYWQQLNVNAAGQTIDEQYGNGLHTFSNYDSITGRLVNRTTGTSGTVQNLSYLWDKVGNLLQRQDLNQNLTEVFVYDNLYRLDYSTLQVGAGTPATNLDVGYDARGNITSKTGLGAYDYTTAQAGCTYYANSQPHAVRKVGTSVYCYDASGNMTSRAGSTIAWTSYNMPSQINSGSNNTQLFYGADRARYKQVSLTATGPLPAGTETTLYVSGGLFEKVTKPNGVIEYRHNIMGADAIAAIRTLRSNSVNDTRYLHKDHLGSVDVVTNEGAAVVVRLAFDAFGKRRNPTGWSGAPGAADWTAIAANTHRGFTSHEHLDNVDLVHMNGRVYDPNLGRFLSPDPVVQQPLLSQSLNRYTYVMNNPLSLVDPSGYSWLSEIFSGIAGFVKTFWRPILAIVVTVITFGYLAPVASSWFATGVCLAPGTITAAGAAFAGGVAGALSTAIMGGNGRDILRAFAISAVMYYASFKLAEKLATMAEQGDGGLYRVSRDATTGKITTARVTDYSSIPDKSALMINGMKNELGTAAANALSQTGRDVAYLYYNPTNSFWQDLVESFTQKIAPTSRMGNDLANLLASTPGKWEVIAAHSQGSLILANAMETMNLQGVSFTSSPMINTYGAASNRWLTSSLAQSVGAQGPFGWDRAIDAVGNVLGLNTFNPFRIIGSILSAPLLFTRWSPHSYYYPQP